MGNMARHHKMEEFGRDHGLIHEVIVTGRKYGAGHGFWSALAHQPGLFSEVVAFVNKRVTEYSYDAHGGIKAHHCPACRHILTYMRKCGHCQSCVHAQGKHCAECANCGYVRSCPTDKSCIG